MTTGNESDAHSGAQISLRAIGSHGHEELHCQGRPNDQAQALNSSGTVSCIDFARPE